MGCITRSFSVWRRSVKKSLLWQVTVHDERARRLFMKNKLVCFVERNKLARSAGEGNDLLYSKRDFSRAPGLLICRTKGYFVAQKLES